MQELCQNTDTLAAVLGALYGLTVLVRPFVPSDKVAALGTVGKVLEVLSGNTGTCKNQPTDEQGKVTRRPK